MYFVNGKLAILGTNANTTKGNSMRRIGGIFPQHEDRDAEIVKGVIEFDLIMKRMKRTIPLACLW
jgi:hypothetical protein